MEILFSLRYRSSPVVQPGWPARYRPVVRDGREGAEEYGGPSQLSFGPGIKHVAYAAGS
jgi:hypothetical protein